MKKNLGVVDKVIRISAAVVIAVLYFAGSISGTLAILLLIVAGILIITSFVGFCPLYAPFKFSTRKNLPLGKE